MRSFTFILKLLAVYTLISSALVISVDKDIDYSQPGENPTPNSFDYSTTQLVQLNVQYDVPQGYQILPIFPHGPNQMVLRIKIGIC